MKNPGSPQDLPEAIMTLQAKCGVPWETIQVRSSYATYEAWRYFCAPWERLPVWKEFHTAIHSAGGAFVICNSDYSRGDNHACEMIIVYPWTPARMAALFDHVNFGFDEFRHPATLLHPDPKANDRDRILSRRGKAVSLFLEMSAEKQVRLDSVTAHSAAVVVDDLSDKEWLKRWAERVWEFDNTNYTLWSGDEGGCDYTRSRCLKMALKTGEFVIGST